MPKKTLILIGSLFVIGVILVLIVIERQNQGNFFGEDLLIRIEENDFLVNGKSIAADKVQNAVRRQWQAGKEVKCYVVLDECIPFSRIQKTLVPLLGVIDEDLLFSTTKNITNILVTPLVCPTTFIKAQVFSLLITREDMRILQKNGDGNVITLEQINEKRNDLDFLRINFSVKDDVTAKRFYQAIADLSCLTNSFLVWYPNVENQ